MRNGGAPLRGAGSGLGRPGRGESRWLVRLLTALVALTSYVAATAAAFPERPVRIIVPFAPGGGTDLIARTLALGMSRDLGQSVVVDNRPGGGTVIGSEVVAKSPSDGYTVLIATFAHAVNPSLQPRLPYDSERDFSPVILIGRGPNVLVVRAASALRSVGDVIALAKASPGRLTYASQGNGTSAHLAGEMFTNLAGVSMVHVPYRGAGPAMTDVLGGQVDMIFGTSSAVATFVEGGKLRALGVTSPARSPSHPDIAAIAETVSGYAVESWYGLYVPAGTPAETITRLNAAGAVAARTAEFRTRVQAEGLEVSAGPPAELEAYVRAEQARWRRIVRENRLAP